MGMKGFCRHRKVIAIIIGVNIDSLNMLTGQPKVRQKSQRGGRVDQNPKDEYISRLFPEEGTPRSDVRNSTLKPQSYSKMSFYFHEEVAVMPTGRTKEPRDVADLSQSNLYCSSTLAL